MQLFVDAAVVSDWCGLVVGEQHCGLLYLHVLARVHQDAYSIRRLPLMLHSLY